ncbi:ATP-binding protein [Streptomyces sp. NPDC051976]|uniref:ATP-binding protein n=1 Tax=Streptomyces sp. NPDC051976 TaxID=3154947 RepID=UPI0034141C6E
MPEIPQIPSLWRFAAHPASVGRARRAVAEALPRGVARGVGDDLGLLTSELVTNAVRYGARAREEEVVEVVLWCADSYCWVAVSDPGSGGRKPAVGCLGVDAEGGRGLVLVDRVAGAWVVRERQGRGTSVIAGVALPRGGG